MARAATTRFPHGTRLSIAYGASRRKRRSSPLKRAPTSTEPWRSRDRAVGHFRIFQERLSSGAQAISKEIFSTQNAHAHAPDERGGTCRRLGLQPPRSTTLLCAVSGGGCCCSGGATAVCALRQKKIAGGVGGLTRRRPEVIYLTTRIGPVVSTNQKRGNYITHKNHCCAAKTRGAGWSVHAVCRYRTRKGRRAVH